MTPSPGAASAIEQIGLLQSKSMTSIAADAIRRMIIDGDLVSGVRINESALADTLGISRGPIREACRSLEQAGLLFAHVNRGMYVREMTLEQARDRYELRAVLAELAGRQLLVRASNADIRELAGLVDQMQVSADQNDSDSYYRQNLAFHDLLVGATRNDALIETYQRTVDQLHLYRRRGLVQEGNLQVSNREHRAIVNAASDGDVEALTAAIVLHVKSGFERFLAAVQGG